MYKILGMPKYHQTKVLVFGDIMLDRYLQGISRRVSPEAPVPVVKIESEDARPGAAANVALNLAMMDVSVSLFGVVGKDQAAKDIVTQLEKKNVSCHFHYLPDGKTTSKLRVLARNQQMIRLDVENNITGYDDSELIEQFQQQLQDADAVVFSDYGKGALQNISTLIDLARQRDIPILVDPKGNDYSIYRHASVITPNLDEFESVVGVTQNNEKIITEKAKELAQRLQLHAMLVTRGKDGMTLVFANDRESLTLCTEAREVFDVTGAGDSVIALLAAGLAAQESYERAAYLSNLAASLVVRKLGTGFVSISELRELMRDKLGMDQGIMSKVELLSVVKDAKARGEKIVMTNGCFDVLHAGHTQYLNQARDLGDRLIVAVNSDSSVKLLKGDSRPLNTLDVRMEMLSALRVVDWVVSFAEETPQVLIEEIVPDVLVKGGDYQIEQIAGHQCVQENGGKVIVLPFRDGYSTTKIIKQFKEDAEKCISSQVEPALLEPTLSKD